MTFPAGSKVIALFNVQVNSSIRSRVNIGTLVTNVIREFRSRGMDVVEGSGLTYCNESQLSVPFSGWTDFSTIVRFVPRTPVDQSTVNDTFAYCWNSMLSGPSTSGRIPTGGSSRAGELFSRCSNSATIASSAGGSIGAFFNQLNPFSDNPNYRLVCARYQVSQNDTEFRRGNVVQPSGTVGRLVSNPVTNSTNPLSVGNNVYDSTDIAGLAGDAFASAGRALDMSGNDIKFFAYAGLGIVAALVGVKLLKEVRKV